MQVCTGVWLDSGEPGDRNTWGIYCWSRACAGASIRVVGGAKCGRKVSRLIPIVTAVTTVMVLAGGRGVSPAHAGIMPTLLLLELISVMTTCTSYSLGCLSTRPACCC
jgi:hypothetical protein